MLPHAELRTNYNQEDAPHITTEITVLLLFSSVGHLGNICSPSRTVIHPDIRVHPDIVDGW